jgi:hypothetical protein
VFDALFPDNSLADLYDPLTILLELLKAHLELDRDAMKLYGFTPQNTLSEAACVVKLMVMSSIMTTGKGKSQWPEIVKLVRKKLYGF